VPPPFAGAPLVGCCWRRGAGSNLNVL